jgi:hypothetical protein
MENEPQQPLNQESAAPQEQPTEQFEAVPSAPQPAMTPQPTQSKRSRRGVVYGIIVLLLIGLGVGAGWFLFGRNSTETAPTKTTAKTTTKTTTSTQSAEATLQPEDVTAKIKTTLAAKYTLLDADTVTKLQSGQVSYRISETSPAYKVDGYNFYNNYAGGSQLSLSGYYVSGGAIPTAAETAMRSEIAKIYTDFGLVKSNSSYWTNDYLTYVYTGKGIICTIESPQVASSGASASCGIIDEYKAAAEKAKPFAAVLPGATATTVIDNVKISDSTVAGYQKASASIGDIQTPAGGHVALFYRKGSGMWKYFLGTQEIVECSKYTTTTDVKNAFMGDTCYDTPNNKESTVK